MIVDSCLKSLRIYKNMKIGKHEKNAALPSVSSDQTIKLELENQEFWADDVLKQTESTSQKSHSLRQNSMQESEGESELLKVEVWKMQSLECRQAGMG